MFTASEECEWRNALLSRYEKLPHYALWRDSDVEKSSLSSRILWWSDAALDFPSGEPRQMIEDAISRLMSLYVESKSAHSLRNE